jgi:hypothetical protein
MRLRFLLSHRETVARFASATAAVIAGKAWQASGHWDHPFDVFDRCTGQTAFVSRGSPIPMVAALMAVQALGALMATADIHAGRTLSGPGTDLR